MTPGPYPQPGDDVPGAPPPLRGRAVPPVPPVPPESPPPTPTAPRTSPVLITALALLVALAAARWLRRRQSHRRSP